MSFQSIVRLVRSRAMLRGGSRVLISARHCDVSPLWRRSRNHWLSTSKEEISWEKTVVSAEPIWKTLQKDDAERDIAAEKDRMLGEIRKSLHENVERILDEKPGVRKKWERIVHRRQKERQALSYSAANVEDPGDLQTTAAGQTSMNHLSSETDSWSDTSPIWSEDTADRKNSDSIKEGFGSAWNSSSLGASESEQIQPVSTLHDSSENQSLLDLLRQPVEEDKNGSGDTVHKLKSETMQDDFDSAWGDASSVGATESEHAQSAATMNEASENLSLLDLLRQPIEEETIAVPELDIASKAVSDGEPSSRPASLLSLLNDEETDFFQDEMDDNRETHSFESSLSDGSQRLTDTSTSSSKPTSLLGLVNDDGIESNADGITTDQHSTGLLEILQEPIEDEHATSFGADKEADVSAVGDLRSQEPFEDEHATSFGAVKEADVSAVDDLWSIDENSQSHNTSLIDDVESLSPSAAIDQGLALLLALEGRDWSQVEDDDENEELDSSREDDPEEIVVEADYVEEEIVMESDYETEENSDEEEDDQEGDDSILDNISDLLEEASLGEISLSSADYNAVLLQVATSPLQVDDAIAMMLKIYEQMSELERFGAACAPDVTTFTILMVTLDRRANAPLSAADICRQMMDSGIELSSEALIQGLHCLDRRNGVKDTERLMNSVLDNETSQLVVPLWAWMSLLKMYKNENMQQEALDLLQKCIKKNGERDVRTVAKLAMETISWPRRDRSGRRLDRSPFLSRLLDTLEPFSRQESTPQEDSTIRVANTDDWLGGTDEHSNLWDEQNTQSYKPSYKVWKRLILSLATEVDRETNSGWTVVHRAFKSMQDALDDYWPDSSLLKTGLKVAEITGDAELAVDLVLRVQDKQSRETEEFESTSLWSETEECESPSLWSETEECESPSLWSDHPVDVGGGSPFLSAEPMQSEPLDVHGEDSLFGWNEASTSEEASDASDALDIEGDLHWDNDDSSPVATQTTVSVRVPLQAFTSAMRVCVATNDTDSTERLLDGLRDSRNTIPTSLKSELFTLALKGYAKAGESDAAQNLLEEMQDGELNPSEEAYGTVIYSLAVTKKTKEACELFDSMETGLFGDAVSPGLTCYNARMLAHVEAHEWDKALECHSQRKEAGLPWSSASFQDVLLASYRLGEKAKALETIEEALESGMTIDYGCCDLSMKILLGDVLKSNSIDQARKKLRELGEQNHDLKKTSLNLSRALRTAEVEEKRQPTNGLKLNEISSKREQAWRGALQHLVNFTRAMEKAEDSKTISSQ